MAYDEELANRVRESMPADVTEKRMFGGLGFMVGGHLTVALGSEDLMVRVGADAVVEALTIPGVSPSIMGTRTMATGCWSTTRPSPTPSISPSGSPRRWRSSRHFRRSRNRGTR